MSAFRLSCEGGIPNMEGGQCSDVISEVSIISRPSTYVLGLRKRSLWPRLTYSLFHTSLPLLFTILSVNMTSRFADPATMRTRSPIFHDESPKRSPPSPSNKAPPSKKLDAKSRAVSEEPCPPVKALQTLSSEPHSESCADKVYLHSHVTSPPIQC